MPNFPDPVNGLVVDNARDLDVDPAVFEAAWNACESLLPPPPSGTAGNTAGNAGWERIVPGGDCACADGSEFAFWQRRADPEKVVFYLDGGGICFDATTCAFSGNGENDFYRFLQLEHHEREPVAGRRDIRLRPRRQSVRRLHVRVRTPVHRGLVPRRRHP